MSHNALLTVAQRDSDVTVIVKPILGNPQLDRAVATLAKSIQECMQALYNLQSAVNNPVADNTMSQNLRDQLTMKKDSFGASWDNYVLFLQRCQGYSDDFLSFLNYCTTHSPDTWAVSLHDCLASSKSLLQEAEELKKGHELSLAQFILYRNTMPARFNRPSSVKVDNRMSKKDHKRTISLNQNSSQFVNAAEASLYPNEFRSMASSIKALDDIGSSLADIEAFWRMESNELSASMGQLRHNLPSRDQIEARVNMWRRYQLGIVGSIPSITLAADAAKVGPIGAGQESKSSPTKRSGIWKRFIGMIAGRRAT